MRYCAFFLLLFSSPSFCDLTIYTYDAMTGKGSLTATLSQKFEAQYKEKIHWVPFGSSGEMVNQLVLEGEKTGADICLGADISQTPKLKKTKLLEPISKDLFKQITPDLVPRSETFFLPFDFSYLAFVYDSKRTLNPPKSLEALLGNSQLDKKMIIEDPRTSSLGLGFLIWTQTVFPDAKQKTFWDAFYPKLLTITSGWSAAYSMFLKGEADYVLSFSTSPGYHAMKEGKDHYQAVLFDTGHYRQVEGAVVLKSSKNKERSRQFLELLLSKEIQEKIPETQVMYPAVKGTTLLKVFEKLPKPKALSIDWDNIDATREALLRQWTLLMVKK